MRQEPEFFGEEELSLIYIAKKLNDAMALEDVFTKAGIDYLVEPDRYSGGTIFRSERIGAFFYVPPEHEETARKVMIRNDYKPWNPEG